MYKVLAAVGLAVAVPVALAAPALAKSPPNAKPPLSSVLRHHEGFRAEVTYLCTGPKDQEGTINVLLRRLPEPGASNVDPVATGRDKAKCDGKEREVKIKLPVAAGALQAGLTVQLETTLTVPGQEMLRVISAAEAVGDDSAPTPSTSPTATGTPSPSASPSKSEQPKTGTPSPSPSSTETEHPESEHPESEHPKGEHPKGEHPESEHPESEHPESEHPESEHPESEHPESEHPETEKPSPSSTPTS